MRNRKPLAALGCMAVLLAALAGIRVPRRAGAELCDCRPVALDESVEVPATLENVVHQVAVGAADVEEGSRAMG